MTVDISVWMDKCLNDCPKWIVEKAVDELSKNLPDIIKNDIRKAWSKDQDHWWSSEHFFFGMTTRNFLRDKVCLDDQLPTGNWDDYYVQVTEIAVGVRDFNQ